ncbi:activated Cdc42 kinase-like isoform X2 [Spodoptera frugiperda]|uniref:non-specific protein-tyrosine kinase n=1 Tax=Spodoptera frugiperda TaxID=7108 RepID=A0A9R0CTP2_SPOFR|nr:activated Cdc42 kinase-like isoform X2 [Spodoptera frugiperda]
MESTSVFEDRENLNDFLEEAELQQYYELFRDILKVTKVSQLKFVLTEDLVQIGLSRPEQRRYKKIYSKYFPNPYISKIRKMLKPSRKRDQNLHGHTSIPLEMQPVFENNVKVPTKHIISIEDITINKELGMGQFGVVQQGTWTTGNQRLQVAIKCLGHERMTSNSTEFLKEAAVMHSIEHPNIVRLYGVVLHLDSLMLVTELAPLRSLLECLREVSLRLNFPVPNLCEFAEQICDGMSYLESKRLIHRDLAARNILVFSKDRVKISDFGLSRALGVGKDYYQTNYNVNLKLPVAWCAPECILFLRFTSASDVWAFGVCLWEMFTYGFQPWAAFSGQQILEAIDAPNFQRLERPECCPEAYYTTMLECWAHDFNNRPKFKDLSAKLASIRPEQVQATVNFQKPEDGRRNTFLEYKSGQVITVLGKETMTKCPLWYGVLPGGACGMFDPTHTKPYTPPEKNVCYVSGSLSPHPVRQSARSIRSSLLRSDVKRHTYTGKRTIQRSMISSPQGDVKHTGHVGLDGAYFGDISFLDPAGCPPRQVVTPYKPSEDLEQVPLINPNSPSHLTGASGTTPYPMLASNKPDTRTDADEVDLSCDVKTRSLKKNRTLSEPTTSKGILSKVRSATLGRSHKGDNSTVPKTDEVHEYHEISDTDTEGTAASLSKSERLALRPESLEVLKSTTDFSQSLLDELDSMFKNLETRKKEDTGVPSRLPEPSTSSGIRDYMRPYRRYQRIPDEERATRSRRSRSLSDGISALQRLSTRLPENESLLAESKPISEENMEEKPPDLPHTLTKSERKKGFSTTTMKPMSAHDERNLDTAIAMANEITSKSMNDLEEKTPHSPSERKFNFRFGRSGHHSNQNQEPEREQSTGFQPRRNFSEEAKSVPDLAASLTEESKLAYTSLIEEPTPSTSLMTQIAKEAGGILKAATIPKPARTTLVQFNSRTVGSPHHTRLPISERHTEDTTFNVLPLPPRTTKPKLVDKPRHVRRYPLKLIEEPKPVTVPQQRPLNIYQNTKTHSKDTTKPDECKSEDVVDTAKDTNPFISTPGTSGANPFGCYLDNEHDDDETELDLHVESDTDSEEETHTKLAKESKDHVSVEDLLEFADQKPCGRQRGVESDEVRIMSKVLKDEASQELCLEALELSGWNVHNAIKLVRVKVSVGTDVSFDKCHEQLQKTNGDIVKAVSMMVSLE